MTPWVMWFAMMAAAAVFSGFAIGAAEDGRRGVALILVLLALWLAQQAGQWDAGAAAARQGRGTGFTGNDNRAADGEGGMRKIRLRPGVWKNPRLWLTLPVLALLLPFALILPLLQLLSRLLDSAVDAARKVDRWASDRALSPISRWIEGRKGRAA